MAITPTREQFTEFAHGTRDGEIVMINLLHFAKGDTDPAPDPNDTTAPSTGAGAYRDYSDQVVKMVESRGGKVIWTGRPENVLIGDSGKDDWDLVALDRARVDHRDAGLAESVQRAEVLARMRSLAVAACRLYRDH